MSKTRFLSKDQDKIKDYQIYNNKLNRLKKAAKKNYLSTQFNLLGLPENNLEINRHDNKQKKENLFSNHQPSL